MLCVCVYAGSSMRYPDYVVPTGMNGSEVTNEVAYNSDDITVWKKMRRVYQDVESQPVSYQCR